MWPTTSTHVIHRLLVPLPPRRPPHDHPDPWRAVNGTGTWVVSGVEVFGVTDFDDFVTTRGPALLRFAYLLAGDAHRAEDLVQEGLARAHGRWAKIRHYDVPEGYVRKAILRQYLSWRRRRSSTEVAVASPPEPPASAPGSGSGLDTMEQVAAREDLWRLLLTLPRMQRAVLVLRYFEDRDDDDIAGLLGCARPTVRVHAFRGLQRLRAALPTANHPME